MCTNAFQELEGQSGALVTSKMQRERNQDLFVQSVTGLGAYVHIAYLSPVGNLHQVLVLGAYHTSVSDAKQTSLQISVCAQGAYCLGSLEKNTLSFWYSRYLLSALHVRCPVHNFNFGSTGGETAECTSDVFHCVLCNSKNGCRAHLQLKESLQETKPLT